MPKSYSQYCPIAHALDLVGERWALLIVRELMNGPLRYTDLAARLPRIGTNILADRLRGLEAGGVVEKRQLPPPAASTVYELTDYGRELRRVLHELAHWGARSLGPPAVGSDLSPGWLASALAIAVAPTAPPGRFQFRVGEEEAALVDGTARGGRIDDPDVVVETDPAGFYHLLVDGRVDGLGVEGDRAAFERLVESVAREASVAA